MSLDQRIGSEVAGFRIESVIGPGGMSIAARQDEVWVGTERS